MVNKFNETICNYFRDNYGTVKNNKEKERKFNEKYKNSTKSQLKKQLKSLKNQSPNNIDEVRYVSKILRSKITEAKTQDQFAQKVYSTDHDNEIKKNFWGYVKFYIEKPKRIIPNFDKKTCFDYFVKSFKCINPLNPITYGGGLFGPDHQIIDHTSKTALSSTSKLGDFLFLSIRHTLVEF